MVFNSDDAIGKKQSALIGNWDINLSIYRLIGFSYDLVGRDLNGVDLNGHLLDGHGVVQVSLAGASRQGTPVKSVELRNTVFYGFNVRSAQAGNDVFSGVTFTATLDDGTSLPLRIDQMMRHPDMANKDVFLYAVSYPTQDSWKPLCGLDQNGNPIMAIPLNGRWDYRFGVVGGGAKIDDDQSFTFACQGYVLAKCVEAGYKPWRTGMICQRGQGCRKITFAGHHQACTRLLRADFCGMGNSFTTDGLEVNMYDGFGIRTDADNWDIEAEWDADGARCIVQERVTGNIPPCMQQRLAADCGNKEHFTAGSLLFSETPPSL